MPIVKTFDFSDFRREFELYGRADQFSLEALSLIYFYLEGCYSDSNFEMDVISICCEFTEMNEDQIRQDYDVADDETIEDYLNDNTSLVGKTEQGTFVFVQF